jgi:SAM-dependent methyltransferase
VSVRDGASGYAYPGGELELFRHAVTWKQYYAGELRPFIGGDVLEVGAGIGATSRFLCEPRHSSWTCLEPDPTLVRRLTDDLAARPLPARAAVRQGTVRTLPGEPSFDTVLYIDVLEHIDDDRAELRESALRLRPGGHVIVLAPAHMSLFSPFDQAIGHLRRYTRGSLVSAGPAGLTLVRAFYLDSLGMVASLGNRLVLRAAHPTETQIRVWDSRLVPLSRVVDRLTGHRLGKTVVAIWTKRA